MKQQLDKKSFITLIAFFIVGAILLSVVFTRNLEKAKEQAGPIPSAADNGAVSNEAYYGKEAINAAGTVYDKDGNIIDMKLLRDETNFYTLNGTQINLPTISPAEYNTIKEGMSYKNICDIIGGKGEVIREVDKPGDKYYTVCYFFYGDKKESSASFILQADSLKSKANVNLAEKNN